MTQLAGASIAARTKGAVAQYRADAVNGNPDAAGVGVTPYDSGTIVTQNRPGKSPEKLVNGTIQNAADLTVHPTPGLFLDGVVPNNALLPNQNGQNYTVDPFTQDAGLSLSPTHE